MPELIRGIPPVASPGGDEDDEARFLAGYDIRTYPRPSLAVDVAVLTVSAGDVHALLVRRRRPPQRGRWALPGGFVQPGESPEAAVTRVLSVKTGLADVYTAQLATFGAPDRDPRGWVVSVAHYALIPADRLPPAPGADTDADADIVLASLAADAADERHHVAAFGPHGELDIAFDHAAILARTIERLRGRLWYAPDALELMPDDFTLLDLRDAYVAILGRPIDKNSFRRRILASGLVAPVGRRREGLRARPAELYRFVRTARHS